MSALAGSPKDVRVHARAVFIPTYTGVLCVFARIFVAAGLRLIIYFSRPELNFILMNYLCFVTRDFEFRLDETVPE